MARHTLTETPVTKWLPQLTADQRAELTADPLLAERFDAAILEHLAAGPRYTFAWSADSVGYTFRPRAVFENVQRTLRFERLRASKQEAA